MSSPRFVLLLSNFCHLHGGSSCNDLRFFRNGVGQLVYRPSRSSLELTSLLNPASLLAGKPLLYEAENDRSKTEKIE